MKRVLVVFVWGLLFCVLAVIITPIVMLFANADGLIPIENALFAVLSTWAFGIPLCVLVISGFEILLGVTIEVFSDVS